MTMRFARLGGIWLCLLALSACGGDDAPAPGPIVVAPAPTPSPPPVATETDAAASPRGVDAQPLSATDVIVTWRDATGDETGFRIERRDGANWTEVATVAANVTSRRLSGLGGGEQAFRVSAVRPTGVAVPSAIATATMPSALAPQIFFVDAAAGNNANPGTEAQPWATIQKAHDVMTAGQTVLVRAGLYTRPNYFTIVQVNRSGTAGAPITFKAFPGERPKLRSTKGVNFNGFEVRANYVVIDGFEIEGHLSEVTLAEARTDQQARQAGGPVVALTASSGITFGRNNRTDPVVHHVTARNNIVRDHPQSGINALASDYVTFENNRVSNTGRYSYFGGSGINIFEPRDFDTNVTEYRNVVRGNISEGNSNEIPCGCFGYRQPTDGNGIIMDNFNNTGYTGRTLIMNNIVRDNGGRGIHVFQSGNVDVFFNTTYRNSTIAITGEGEITMRNATNVRVLNNIMVASADRPANLVATSTNVLFDFNLIFSGTSFTQAGGSSNLTGTDPLFVTTTGAMAFMLSSGSLAVDRAGGGVPIPMVDAYLAPRPRGRTADIGAVESL
jgi:hypothetical protein